MSFQSDGCTNWLDGWWRQCCVVHDELYYLQVPRELADAALGLCVAFAGTEWWQWAIGLIMGIVMFIGVRLFGQPYYEKREETTMQTSAKGRAFIKQHEGNPLTAYLDPVGVPTIGPGLTRRNDVVKMMLPKIIPGKTKITAKQADRIFEAVLAQEIDPTVTEFLPGAEQHEHDAAASGSYNLGVYRFMRWEWARLWRSGAKKAAWRYLGDHYNTANGKKLPGLVRRRKEEALLGDKGIYTGISHYAPEGVERKKTVAPKQYGPDPVVKEAQEMLTKAGFNPGKIDGWPGKMTEAAVLAYQKTHPHLKNDGIIGKATLSQLRRDVTMVKDVAEKTLKRGVPSSALAGVAAFFTNLPWGYIAVGVLVLAIAYFLWKNRDSLKRRWNKLTGKVVEV